MDQEITVLSKIVQVNLQFCNLILKWDIKMSKVQSQVTLISSHPFRLLLNAKAQRRKEFNDLPAKAGRLFNGINAAI